MVHVHYNLNLLVQCSRTDSNGNLFCVFVDHSFTTLTHTRTNTHLSKGKPHFAQHTHPSIDKCSGNFICFQYRPSCYRNLGFGSRCLFTTDRTGERQDRGRFAETTLEWTSWSGGSSQRKSNGNARYNFGMAESKNTFPYTKSQWMNMSLIDGIF